MIYVDFADFLNIASNLVYFFIYYFYDNNFKKSFIMIFLPQNKPKHTI
jgi:hypothetical protein